MYKSSSGTQVWDLFWI